MDATAAAAAISDKTRIKKEGIKERMKERIKERIKEQTIIK